MGACGVSGELYHPVPADIGGPAALGVVSNDDPGLVTAVPAGAGGDPVSRLEGGYGALLGTAKVLVSLFFSHYALFRGLSRR